MKKKRLRKSDIRELNDEISQYSFEIGKKDDVEIIEDEKRKVVSVGGEILFFYHDDKPVPTVKCLQKGARMKQVVVDMGAVRFMASGADVMRPGIVEIDDGISAGTVVGIVDVTHKKPLAVGVALFGSDEMRGMGSGKVIKSIHYVGDDIWNFGA